MTRYSDANCQVCGERHGDIFHHCPATAENAEKWADIHHQIISDMCQGRRQFRMTIPVDDQDTDILLANAMAAQRDYIEQLEAQIASLKSEVDE